MKNFENAEMRLKGLWIEDRQSKFDDFTIVPLHLIQIIMVFLCRESCYFEDISKL